MIGKQTEKYQFVHWFFHGTGVIMALPPLPEGEGIRCFPGAPATGTVHPVRIFPEGRQENLSEEMMLA